MVESDSICMFSLHLILLVVLLISYTTVSTDTLSVNNQLCYCGGVNMSPPLAVRQGKAVCKDGIFKG